MTTHLDQAFLIDVSEADDCLLPTGGKATLRNVDNLRQSGTCSPSGVPGHEECNGEGIDPILEKLPLSQAVSLPEERVSLDLPVMSQDPAAVKKKKKSSVNIRKSMAWNNAFLTEEGVLDSEELSLVNKTFQKASGPAKQSNLKKLSSTSKLPKPPLMPKTSLAPPRVVFSAESKEQLIDPASSSFHGSMETLFEPHSNDITGPHRVKNKANRSLSQGNMVSGKKEILDISGHAYLSGSKPPLLRRSIDMNEQAPNPSTCNGRTQVKHVAHDSRPSSHTSNLEANRPPFMELTMERLSSTSVSQAQPRTSLLKLHSGCSSSKTHSALKKSSVLEASEAFTSRSKPSGLRMPSPKLGFFDTNRTGSQVAVLRERTTGHGSGGSGARCIADRLDAEISGSRTSTNRSEHLVNSAKFGHQLLEASRNQNTGTKNSTRIPMAPQVRGRNGEFASLQLAPAYESRRPASLSVSLADSARQALYARKIGNAAIRGKPGTAKAKGQENLSPESRNMPRKCTLALDLATGNRSIQVQPATSKASAEENLSPEGTVMGQKYQGLSMGNPTIKATGSICISEVERACDSQASLVKP